MVIGLPAVSWLEFSLIPRPPFYPRRHSFSAAIGDRVCERGGGIELRFLSTDMPSARTLLRHLTSLGWCVISDESALPRFRSCQLCYFLYFLFSLDRYWMSVEAVFLLQLFFFQFLSTPQSELRWIIVSKLYHEHYRVRRHVTRRTDDVV